MVSSSIVAVLVAMLGGCDMMSEDDLTTESGGLEIGPLDPPPPTFDSDSNEPYTIPDLNSLDWYYTGPACGLSGVFDSPCGFSFPDEPGLWAYTITAKVADCHCNGPDLGHGPCWSYGPRTYWWWRCR